MNSILLLVAVLSLGWASFADASAADRVAREAIFQASAGVDGSEVVAEIESVQTSSGPLDIAPRGLPTRLPASPADAPPSALVRAVRDRSPPLR